jgi:hypothetical protein
VESGPALGLVAVVALAFLAAGCGGGSPGSHVAHVNSPTRQSSTSSSAAASTQENGALVWARCVRSNGVPNLPDPTGNNAAKIPSAQQLGVSGSVLQAAEQACQHLLPNGGRPPSQAEQQQVLSGLRLHGIPDENSPQFQNVMRECGHLVPEALGGIRVRQ